MDMGKTTNLNQRIRLGALLLILSLSGAGCGSGAGEKSPEQVPQPGSTGVVVRTGVLHDGYFYEEDGIVVSSGERFLYSDWEPVDFDYLCMDPSCSHLGAGCSAHAVSNEGKVTNDFSFLYRDRLIILHTYCEVDSETVTGEDAGTEMMITEVRESYYTDVYEADLDGSNRRKKADFQGGISNTVTAYSAVLADGKLYFGGPAERNSRWKYTDGGANMTSSFWLSDAIYCLDLENYTMETFAVTQDKEGQGDMYQLYEYDGMIYAVVSSFLDDRAVWYRIDPAAGTCEEFLRFDANVARFCGAIGDTVYYFYEDSPKTLYARDIAEEAAEREIMTVTGEDMHVIAFVLDGQLLIQTDRVYEGENRMTEYALLDRDGNLLNTIRYDDYIVFLDAFGDKLIYFRMGSSGWEHWWADKEALTELVEAGTKLGPFQGSGLDTLSD